VVDVGVADEEGEAVEVGHHERRRDYGETDGLVAAKVAAVRRWGMTAIVCIGEVLRELLDRVAEWLDRQLEPFKAADADRLVIAYEPAGAIGVGATAAPASLVGEAHAAVRSRLAAFGPRASGALDPRVFAIIARTPVR
jgi:triosephosphate isomerase (TIM)